MKICLRVGHHAVYDDLVNYPPEGVEYIIPKFVIQSKLRLLDYLKKKLWITYLHLFNKPHSIYIPCGRDIDLIHACSGILPKNKFPWVLDIEHVASFVGFWSGKLQSVKHEIETILSSDYCKKIMPWTNAAKKSIICGLDTSNFKNKLEVVYPAIHTTPFKKQKIDDKVRLLFVSNRFYQKGGREILEAFEILSKKYNIELTMISEVPEEFKNKYKSVIFREPIMPRDQLLKEYFSKSDIFVLPTYIDTFGMVFLEAMNCNLPIVSNNVFAVPEIVEDGKNGFLVSPPITLFDEDLQKKRLNITEYIRKVKQPEVVNGLVEKLSILIESNSLRRKMGRSGRKEVEKGKFSIGVRNKKLKRIYEEAMKR